MKNSLTRPALGDLHGLMTWTEQVWALFSTAAYKVAKYTEVYSDAQVFVGAMKPRNTYLEFPFVPHTLKQYLQSGCLTSGPPQPL